MAWRGWQAEGQLPGLPESRLQTPAQTPALQTPGLAHGTWTITDTPRGGISPGLMTMQVSRSIVVGGESKALRVSTRRWPA